MNTTIELVPAGDIDPNPFRLLGDYPYSAKKLSALDRSYAQVGMWEGIIGRRKKNRVEIAFGHHRHKAALNAGMSHLPIILRDLTDEQMIQFMGRENLEDYNAEFLVMLETWEAGVKFSAAAETGTQAVDIARLLGWTSVDVTGNDKMNNTARACNAASALIKAGHLVRADLADMAVKSAREIVERAQNRVEQIDKWAAEKKVDKKIVEQEKKHVAGAAKDVAKQVRGGKIAQKDVKTQIDLQAFGRQIKATRQDTLPKFRTFGESLANQIQKMLANDSSGDKLRDIAKVVEHVTHHEDIRILGRIAFELDHLIQRASDHRRDIQPKQGKNVTPLSTKALPSS
jgi:ParB-like chromosome segregation protein Spo0J